MRKFTTLLATGTAGLALLCSTPVWATDFSFQGNVTDGPLLGTNLSGSFSYDLGALLPGASAELPLSAFSLQIGANVYTLASADLAPSAVFALGQFVGLSYVDTSSANVAQRPWVAFIPGFDSFAEAYLAYVTAPNTAGVSAGFGSYSVTVVPEPTTAMLWLAGLAGVGALTAGRRRASLATAAGR